MDYKLVFNIFKDLFKIDTISYDKCDVLTVANDTDRSFILDGKAYSPHIDSIEFDLKKAGLKCISISRIASDLIGEKAFGDVYSPKGGFARALLTKRLKGLLFRREYPYSNHEERIWGKILDSTEAKKVIAILPSRELCNACHKRNIWVADVQHGVIAENHPWYGKKFRGNDPAQFLPNLFLVWDEESANVLKTYVYEKGSGVEVIGNRWVARFLEDREEDDLIKRVHSLYKDSFSKNSKPNILVSLSWGCEGIPNGIITDELLNVILKTSDQYRWMFRMHPNQVNGFAKEESKVFYDFFDNNLKGKADWENPTYAPLPYILSKTDLHISWHSSVATEAAQLGVKSLLMDPQLVAGGRLDNYYLNIRESKCVEVLGELDFGIEDWIEANVSNRGSENTYSQENTIYWRVMKQFVI